MMRLIGRQVLECASPLALLTAAKHNASVK